MTSIFISYSHRDREFVKKLAAELQQRLPDVEVFYDMLIQPGASWAQALASQIERATVILAVLSPDYLVSTWAQQELNVALDRHLRDDARLLPLLVAPCSPTGFVAQLAWVDFTEDYEQALARLIWGITGERPRSAKGEQPGAPTQSLDQRRLGELRQEVREAAEQFKSEGVRQPDSGAPTRTPSRASNGEKRCFVVMPFNDEPLDVVYNDFVKPAFEEKLGLICERGDDIFGSNVIMSDIRRSIEEAHVILADLTRKNANVFYEIGICHALSKPVLLLAQSLDDVPFDLRHHRILIYDYTPGGCKRLERIVVKHMQAVLDSE